MPSGGRDDGPPGLRRRSSAEAFFVWRGSYHRQHEEPHITEPRINDRIRVAEVRLVGPNGEQVGIVRVEDALRLAQEADLDLVEVAPDARPPVCKLMDFGKFKYEADMKAREARRNQANTVLKEIRFRLKIDPHDYGTKKGHVERFLKGGDKVKVMIMFRGREQSRPEMGVRLLQRLADDVVELGFIESMPKQDGRNMIMVLGPTKKKADAKNEQRKQRAAEPERGSSTQDASEPEAPVVEAAPVEAAPVVEVAPVVEAAPVEGPWPSRHRSPRLRSRPLPPRQPLRPLRRSPLQPRSPLRRRSLLRRPSLLRSPQLRRSPPPRPSPLLPSRPRRPSLLRSPQPRRSPPPHPSPRPARRRRPGLTPDPVRARPYPDRAAPPGTA